MTDERLTGLALMYIHKDISLDEEAIIGDFANSGHHKIDCDLAFIEYT